MMGRSHSLSGSVAFLAVLPYLPHASAPEVVVATVCAAGAGILPDLDHQSGTASRSFGPISHAMCVAIATVSGGHRHATHSLLGIVVFTGIAWEASSNLWALGALLWICLGFAVRSLHHRKHPKDHLIGLANAVACAGVAYLLALHVSTHHPERVLVTLAVAIGVTAHIAGDMCTEHGVPLAWPDMRRFRVATIDTDSRVERHGVVPLLLIAFVCLVGARSGLLDFHSLTHHIAWR